MDIQFNGRTGAQISSDINQKFDEIEQIVNDAETGALASRDAAALSAADAQGYAEDAESAKGAAEAARDSTFFNAGRTFTSTTLGLAGSVDGQQFAVVEGDYVQIYTRTNSTTATLVTGARYATTAITSGTALQSRIFNLPSRTTFDNSTIEGPVSSDMVTPASDILWNINANGAIAITGNSPSSSNRHWWTGFERFTNEAFVSEAEFSFTGNDSGRAMISIGTPGISSTTISYGFTAAGVLAVWTGSAFAVTSVDYRSIDGVQWVSGQKIKVRLAVNTDNTGVITVWVGSKVVSSKVENVPSGRVFVTWRSTSTGFIHSFVCNKTNLFENRPLTFSQFSTLVEDNILPADFNTPFEIQTGGATANEWRLDSNPGTASFVKINSKNALRINGNKAIRCYVNVAPAENQTVAYHLECLTACVANPFTSRTYSSSVRFAFVQYTAGVENSRVERQLQAEDTLSPISGVVELNPTTDRLLAYIGSITGYDLDIHSFSYALSSEPGFRPKRKHSDAAVAILGERISEVESIVGAGSFPVTLDCFSLIPDSYQNRPTRGFTCTGLDRVTRGKYAGCWVVGDDGRLTESAPGPYVPKVHIITPDFANILISFVMPYSDASVQGIAVDTSGGEDTFWVATAGDAKLRHFDMDGAEISADVFDWIAAGYSSNPNGLAYDPINHALWVTAISPGGIARLISCNSTLPRLITTTTITNTPDMLHYDSERSLLFYSWGSNGADGSIRVKSLLDGTDVVAYGPLQHAQAIEGFFIDRQSKKLTVVNDGGFHTTAKPELNIWLRYSVPLFN